jgi:probable rRNA maturation factor
MPSRRKSPRVVLTSSVLGLRIPRRRIVELVSFVARAEAVALGDVDIAVVTSREIASVHRAYLSRAGATDVICFDLSDQRNGQTANDIHAQILVCGQVARREAAARGRSIQRELLLYVLHGLLHLAGYDDTDADQAKRMHARQEELLEAFWKTVRP